MSNMKAINNLVNKVKALNSKQKAVIGGVSVALVAGIGVGSYSLLSQTQETAEESVLRGETFQFEYGKAVKTNVSYYVSSAVDASEYTLEMDIPNEDDKEYPAMGSYEAKLVSEDTSEDFTITVVDTVAPIVTITEEDDIITVEKGTKDFDPLDYVVYVDYDNAEFTCEGEYDIDTVGEYEITVVATDTSGNVGKATATVKVVEADEDEDKSGSSSNNSSSNNSSSSSSNNSSSTTSGGTASTGSSSSSSSNNSSSSSSSNNSSSSSSSTSNKGSSSSSSSSNNNSSSSSNSSNSSSSSSSNNSSSSSNSIPVDVCALNTIYTYYPTVYATAEEAIAVMDDVDLMIEYFGSGATLTIDGSDGCGWRICAYN